MKGSQADGEPGTGAGAVFSRRKLIYGAGALLGGLTAAGWGAGLFDSKTASAGEVLVYKSPTCGCCQGWVKHMRDNGFDVSVRNVDDVDPYKKSAGVPDDLVSCHTALIGDYVIEGHVPAASVLRLLAERPAVRGLAAPGMPAGSPGMEGAGREPYTVFAFDSSGGARPYAHYR